MKNGKKISEEVEKTLNAFDHINYLDENPYLFTRLQAEIERSEIKGKRYLKEGILRPAILLITIVINILTAIYFIDSGSQNSAATRQQYLSKISSEYTLSHSYYSGINQTTGN
jgi:hypothetical protein